MSLTVIAFIIAIVIFGLPVFALVRTSQLDTRIRFLEKNVRRLSEELAARPAATPQPQAVAEPAKAEDAPAAEEPTVETPSLASDDAAEATSHTMREEMGEARKAGPKAEPKGPPPASAPPPPPPPPVQTSLEEKVGTRWTIWVGGLALALGGLFLVRYSIEYGLLGPRVRLALAGLLALALLGLGEFLRRRDVKLNFAGARAAQIPAILTAAGILTGFAAVYAAFALYHFLPAIAAFVLLAAVSLAGLALSAVHGPGLAALGLAGSYATPILAGGDSKNVWALFIYLLFVTAASLAAARLRSWLWLAACALAAALAWAVLVVGSGWEGQHAAPLAVYLLGLTGLALTFLAARPAKAAPADSLRSGHDLPGLVGLAAISWLAGALLRYDSYSTLALGSFIIVIIVHLGAAWRWPSLRMLAPWSAFLSALAVLTWHFPLLLRQYGPYDLDMGLVPVAPPELLRFLAICGGLAALYGAAGFAGALKRGEQYVWPGVAVLTPLLLLIIAYWRATGFAHSLPFGLAAVGLAALYAVAAEYLHRTKQSPANRAWSEGILLAGAFAALALALTMVLDKGWLTVAIALLCPALAWIEGQRPVPVLRPIAAGLAAIVAARLVWNPLITDEAGAMPVFNWLLYAYGVPALAFAAAGHMFGQRRDDRIVQIFEAAAIVFTAALAALQVRHLLNNGNILSTKLDLTEVAVHTLVWLGLSLGLRRVDIWRGRIVARYAAMAFGFAGIASILVGHLVLFNPLNTGDSVGAHPVFNVLLLAYLLPGLACALIYWQDPARPRPPHIRGLGIAALVLIFAWLSLQVRALFAGGGVLASGTVTDTEWYVYSAVWLVFGLALLGAGVALGASALRHGAFAVIVLTIAKVFLFDMSNLTGIYRALSFLGLGAVLIGIGYLYQKVVFPQTENADQEHG